MTVRNTAHVKNGKASRRAAPESANSPADRAPVSTEECERMIAVEAYLRAERRGFAPGHELEDWYEAKAEVTQRLNRSFGPS